MSQTKKKYNSVHNTTVIKNTVFTVFRLLTDFVCLYTYEFWLSIWKIVRSSVILLLPLYNVRYNWNIVESGVEHHKTNKSLSRCYQTYVWTTSFVTHECIRHPITISSPVDKTSIRVVCPLLTDVLFFRSWKKTQWFLLYKGNILDQEFCEICPYEHNII